MGVDDASVYAKYLPNRCQGRRRRAPIQPTPQRPCDPFNRPASTVALCPRLSNPQHLSPLSRMAHVNTAAVLPVPNEGSVKPHTYIQFSLRRCPQQLRLPLLARHIQQTPRFDRGWNAFHHPTCPVSSPPPAHQGSVAKNGAGVISLQQTPCCWHVTRGGTREPPPEIAAPASF